VRDPLKSRPIVLDTLAMGSYERGPHQRIKDDHLIALLCKIFRRVAPYHACTTGNEHAHPITVPDHGAWLRPRTA